MPKLASIGELASLVIDRIGINKDEGKPYIGLEHMPSNGSALLGTSPASVSTSINGVFRAGDILFGKLRPQLRKSLRANFDGYCSTDVLILRPKVPHIADFVSFVLSSESTFREAIRTEEGTKMPRCSWNSIERVQVFCPDGPEQRRIAEILSTVDEAIEQTEALIAKYQQIKSGLMHDLFTRGLTPDGHLRPTRTEAPHLYKQSPLGWIPLKWDFMIIAALAESLIDGPFGSNLKSEHYVIDSGIRVVRLQNIDEGSYNDSDVALISREHASSLNRHQVVSGDILIAALGEDNNAVGRACCYPGHLPPAINKADCFRLRCKPSLAQDSFVMQVLNTSAAREQVRRLEQGVTRRRVNTTSFSKIVIPLPDLWEQKAIGLAIEKLSTEIDVTAELKAKAQFVRAGLMQDLLTGRVRVPLPELTTA